MFTGIIQNVAPITEIADIGAASPASASSEAAAWAQAGSRKIRVATGFKDLEPGESIAINGVCLTVTEYDAAGSALFFVSPETLDKTNLGALQDGARVNLERAVTLGTRLSGHLVQGHVDGVGRLASVTRQGQAGSGDESYVTRFEIPARLARYCVEKGSIALNGVSLTINALESAGDAALVSITLIPHTWAHTQFSDAHVGDPVNVEVDVLAKYVEKLGRPYMEKV
jgi:riboflavin synthase